MPSATATALQRLLLGRARACSTERIRRARAKVLRAAAAAKKKAKRPSREVAKFRQDRYIKLMRDNLVLREAAEFVVEMGELLDRREHSIRRYTDLDLIDDLRVKHGNLYRKLKRKGLVT